MGFKKYMLFESFALNSDILHYLKGKCFLKGKFLKKVLSTLAALALIVTSVIGFSVTSSAASDVTAGFSEDAICSMNTSGKVYCVGTESELRNAINVCRPNEYIKFCDNIEVKDKLYIGKNYSAILTIDLNGYSLRFNKSVNGLVIDRGPYNCVHLCNGSVYGDIDSNSAICLESGDLRIYNCSIYAGNCVKHNILYYGNALYCNSECGRVALDSVYLQGGDGYSKGVFNKSRTGKAIYRAAATEIYSVGKGYTYCDGQYR